MAGQKCRRVDGSERDSSHAERHELAVLCGAKQLLVLPAGRSS
jgi:hypothetical protein